MHTEVQSTITVTLIENNYLLNNFIQSSNICITIKLKLTVVVYRRPGGWIVSAVFVLPLAPPLYPLSPAPRFSALALSTFSAWIVFASKCLVCSQSIVVFWPRWCDQSSWLVCENVSTQPLRFHLRRRWFLFGTRLWTQKQRLEPIFVSVVAQL